MSDQQVAPHVSAPRILSAPHCPHCQHEIAPEELKSLWAAWCVSQRKTVGRNGGRPAGSKDKQPRKRTVEGRS
jgi:hypothetical protein